MKIWLMSTEPDPDVCLAVRSIPNLSGIAQHIGIGKDEEELKCVDPVRDEHGNIMLAPLIESIKDQGFSIRNHVVSYFS